VQSSATMAKAAASEITLPKDCQCSVALFSHLFNKPEVRVRRGRQSRLVAKAAKMQAMGGGDGSSLTLDDCGGDDGGFDDSFDDGGGDGGHDCGDDDVWAAGGDVDGGGEVAAGGASLKLIDAPAQVEKIQIGYAKKATQVDIRGLKVGLWSLLTAAFDKQATAAKPSPVSFQSIVAELPSVVPAHGIADISFAYCFICLLHLANKEGLEIHGEGELADLSVVPPPGYTAS